MLPALLWTELVAPYRVQSIVQIVMFDYLTMSKKRTDWIVTYTQQLIQPYFCLQQFINIEKN